MSFSCKSNMTPRRILFGVVIIFLLFSLLTSFEITNSFDDKWPVKEWHLEKCNKQVLFLADSLLSSPSISIAYKKILPPSGNKHDYLSMGPYWWPNPNSKDGLPYINRDGLVNPEVYNYNDDHLYEEMVNAVNILARAYHQTGDYRYSRRAAEYIDVFFVKRRTRMNPNLKYAQFVPGRREGRAEGTITISVLNPVLLASIGELEHSPNWPKSLKRKIHKWMRDFYHWITTHEYGVEASRRRNNIGTYYYYHILSLLKYMDEPEIAEAVIKESVIPLIKEQISKDGAQHYELERTKSFNYSLDNMKAILGIADLSTELGVDLWGYEENGQCFIKSMIDFYVPYVKGEKQWEWEQIIPFYFSDLNVVFAKAAEHYGDTYSKYLIK